jgi:hypothetical protein
MDAEIAALTSDCHVNAIVPRMVAETTSPPVVYARVPISLKADLDAYARRNSLTLTAAVIELLEGGLKAVVEGASVSVLESRVTTLDRELGAARIALAESNAELSSLRAREQEFHTLAQRADQPVGSCPFCKTPVLGTDVLLSQRCPHCNRGLSTVLFNPQMKGLDQTELLILLGTLGIIVGAAYLQSKSGGLK